MLLDKYPFAKINGKYYLTKSYHTLWRQGYLEYKDHPTLPLRIWNYTRKCQYDRKWTPETVTARGLITTKDDEVITPAFPKFYNWGEPEVKEDIEKLYEIKGKKSVMLSYTDKWDGSFGIVFHYGGEWHVASRGSFDSLWALKGKDILSYYMPACKLNASCIYLVEIIFKGNRILVDYGDRNDLVILGILERDEDLGWRDVSAFRLEKYDIGDKNGRNFILPSHIFTIACKEDLEDIVEQLRSEDPGDASKEGYVVTLYYDPENLNLKYRFKVKFASYLELHKNVIHISERDVWEICCGYRSEELFINHLPDEFDEWYREKKAYYMSICTRKYAFFESMQELLNVDLSVYWNRNHPENSSKKLGWIMLAKSSGMPENEYGVFIKWLGGNDVRKQILAPYRPKGVQTIGLSRIQ